ncbi:anti-sigma factor [Microbacterium sp. zg.Y1090]|uniref:anti-sigma factor n=1 Tax=Microbacterium wangruii TaxID=3049073 RepID=UPI00214B9BD7|nr:MULTISPECIES: anti-sigma factor [unclassified Microbacterium]MCR2817391.1 anti-sigma factor [Microbacterium sp. zg.Y1090]MDL5485950.1 anti-sigma factor [Microbacterium sp. zg-Y1211]WIM29123.1 anti-sigma factor [Microbacterium sp. zg-Y1090]
MTEQDFAELAAGHALHALSHDDEAAYWEALAANPAWEQIAQADAAAAAALADAVRPVAPPLTARSVLLARVTALAREQAHPAPAAAAFDAADDDVDDSGPVTHVVGVVPPPPAALRPPADPVAAAPPVPPVPPLPPVPPVPPLPPAAAASGDDVPAAPSRRRDRAAGETTDAAGAEPETQLLPAADPAAAAVDDEPAAEPASGAVDDEPVTDPASGAVDDVPVTDPASGAVDDEPVTDPASGAVDDLPAPDHASEDGQAEATGPSPITGPNPMTGLTRLFGLQAAATSPISVPPASGDGAEPPTTTTAMQAVVRQRWTRGLIALAACLTLLVGVGFGAGAVHNWLNRPASVVALDEVRDAPDAQSATVVMEGGLTMTAYWSAEQGKAVLVTDGLPPIPTDETFEMWLIRDDEPTSAGTFTPQSGSRATSVIDSEVQPGDVFAITVEPAGGSPNGAPTSDPIVAVPTA